MYQWEVALVRNRPELVDNPQLLRGCPTRNIEDASCFSSNRIEMAVGNGDISVLLALPLPMEWFQYWRITRSRRNTNEQRAYRASSPGGGDSLSMQSPNPPPWQHASHITWLIWLLSMEYRCMNRSNHNNRWRCLAARVYMDAVG